MFKPTELHPWRAKTTVVIILSVEDRDLNFWASRNQVLPTNDFEIARPAKGSTDSTDWKVDFWSVPYNHIVSSFVRPSGR